MLCPSKGPIFKGPKTTCVFTCYLLPFNFSVVLRNFTMLKNNMHPKNIYKNPPNFKELAAEFPEFRKYVRQELSGKVSIDFQDPNAVKELTKTLLKRDFDLDVVINESRLIPRVPLCLNYILWVEDLLQCISPETQPLGIDIGTGCIGIYSLLAAKRGWKMLATEIDTENFQSAQANIQKNNLENNISLKLVINPNQLIIEAIDDKKYDFCMCNPPFFKQNEKPQNRSSRRPQLEISASDTPTEISTEGGELSFISKLIKESSTLKDQIKIYTTLIGKKSDFLVLKKEIQNISPKSTAFTEFCQGKTMRWGLAWTFLDINLKSITTEPPKNKKNKSKPPLTFTIPYKTSECLNEVFTEAKNILNDLKIKFKEESLDIGSGVCFKAYENTWSHQRRKKRMKARVGEPCTEETGNEEEDIESSEAKRRRLNDESEKPDESDRTVLVEGMMCFKKENSSLVLEMSWLEGNKECFYQIFQYFKNFWMQNKSPNK